MRLNDSERTMVEENHNLIFWIINMYKLEASEYYDLLAIELCHAVRKYNPEKGSLSNYYKIRCDSVLKREYAKNSALKNTHNGLFPLTDYNEGVDEMNVEDIVELEQLLDGEYGQILRMKLHGYNQSEIAEHFGVTQSYVSKLLSRLKGEFYDG